MNAYQVTVPASAASLLSLIGSVDARVGHGVIQAMRDNVSTVYVGDSASQPAELDRSQSMVIENDSLAEIYVKGNGTDKVAVLIN